MPGARASNQFISAADLAGRLGVKSATVRRWARLCAIPKLVLPGGRYVFNVDTVIASLERRQAPDPAQPQAVVQQATDSVLDAAAFNAELNQETGDAEFLAGVRGVVRKTLLDHFDSEAGE